MTVEQIGMVAGTLYAMLVSSRALIDARASKVRADAKAVEALVERLDECESRHASAEKRLDAMAREFSDFRKEVSR